MHIKQNKILKNEVMIWWGETREKLEREMEGRNDVNTKYELLRKQ